MHWGVTTGCMGAETILGGGFQEGDMTGDGWKVVFGRAPPKGMDGGVWLLVTGVMVGVVECATGRELPVWLELVTMATGIVVSVVPGTVGVV